MSVLHSCTMLKPLDGMRCHLAETLVWSKYNDTVLDRGPVPHGKEIFGVGTPVYSNATYHQITLALVIIITL